MGNDEVEAREIYLEFSHVSVKAFMQLRAFAGSVIQVLCVEAIIVRAQSSGACFNAAGEYLFTNTRHSQFGTLLDELLKCCRKMADLGLELLKLTACDSPRKKSVAHSFG